MGTKPSLTDRPTTTNRGDENRRLNWQLLRKETLNYPRDSYSKHTVKSVCGDKEYTPLISPQTERGVTKSQGHRETCNRLTGDDISLQSVTRTSVSYFIDGCES